MYISIIMYVREPRLNEPYIQEIFQKNSCRTDVGVFSELVILAGKENAALADTRKYPTYL